MSEETAFCWQVDAASRSASTSPVPQSKGPKTATSTPNSPRRQKIGLPRQRQSMSGSSPLHVAAMFASAMAAKTAIGSEASSNNTMRQDSLNRLYMTSDEVFKAWEASLKVDDEEEKKFQQQKSGISTGRAIKKFSSIELCDTAAIRRRQLVLQKQQQQQQEITNPMGGEEDADTSGKEKDKLSPDNDTTQHPLGRSAPTSILRRHSSTVKPQTAVQAIGQLADARRRFSGAITNDSSNIKKVDLDAEYNVRKQLGTGRFGYVKLGEHKQSGMKIAMKFFPRPQTKQSYSSPVFFKNSNEYFLGRFCERIQLFPLLSPHPNILDTFEGMFQAKDESAFFFVQEFCPNASLREAVESHPGGIGEAATKALMIKVLSAIEFMHGEGLVHRNIKAENILIFDSVNYSRVKVTDFGLTRKTESTVKHLEYVNSYHAPELCETVVKEVLTVNRSIDVWALGIVIFYCFKGRFPWQKATIMCKQYWEWDQWLKHKLPQLPKHYELYTEKALKLFKRCLNPRSKDRWSVKDLKKFVEKERLIKVKSSGDDMVYYPDENNCRADHHNDSGNNSSNSKQKRSTITKLINNTFNAMAVVSEQVVSAHD